MKYQVNDSCIGCGLCEGTCPEVFRIENGMAVAIDTDVDESAQTAAAQAQEECPVGAIETI